MSTEAGDPITAHGGAGWSTSRHPRRSAARRRATPRGSRRCSLSARDLADLEMLASGAFSPLTGFMGEADYVRSRDAMRLASGVPWSIPITLGVSEAEARALKPGEDIALVGSNGGRLAMMKLAEVYQRRSRARGRGGLRHRRPGASGGGQRARDAAVVPGRKRNAVRARFPGRTFLEYRLEPRQTRAAFAERGWRKIVAFQTRNPTHRAHEYIQKAALEICDGLLLHPLVGETKGDDVPAAVRMETYKVLLDLYYPRDRAMLSVMPAHMRYGGPARSDSARHHPAQLRLHAFHRRPRPRRGRQLLRHL